jgi:signal transduction histidine kinase
MKPEHGHNPSDERTARAEAEAAQRKIAFLYQVSGTLFAGPLDERARLKTLASLVVPDLADWCIVDRVAGDAPTSYERVVISHWDPEKIEHLGTFPRELPLLPDAAMGVSKVLTRGRSELVSDVSPELLATIAASGDPLLGTLGARSYLVVPLAGVQRPIGAITFVFAESNRRYGTDDVALAEDLSQRAALALENARLYQQARDAVRLREDLLAIVSHDLRNPLNAISVTVDLLGRAQPTPESTQKTRDYAERLRRLTTRMEHLIRDLLSFASIGAGRLTLELQPTPVEDLIREALEVMQATANTKGVTVTVADGAPSALVRCDKERALQVFSNLLGNAIKFSAGGAAVHLEARATGDEIEFSIADSGPGIAPEALSHIFERYWQAEETREGAGLGLGLYIAKGITDAHRGRIWAESTVGQGSRFHFTLPVQRR